MVDSILDDIWECAAEMHANAQYNIDMYKNYGEHTRRAENDRAIAQRVMDWVKEQRKD